MKTCCELVSGENSSHGVTRTVIEESSSQEIMLEFSQIQVEFSDSQIQLEFHRCDNGCIFSN